MTSLFDDVGFCDVIFANVISIVKVYDDFDDVTLSLFLFRRFHFAVEEVTFCDVIFGIDFNCQSLL